VQGRYPIRAVAKITGLSLDTLRAWERRYQAVTPEHTERGREYGPEHIERLMLLNRLNQNGHAIGRIASLSDDELRGLLAGSPEETAPSIDLTGPVMKAIESFDAARASDELSRLAAVLTPRDLVYQVAVPLMKETGSRWHRGTLAIAQEHLVSQLLRNLLGGMMRLFRPQGGATKMVLATPSGETHEFGILAAAMLASLAGLEPVYLGPDLPAGEIAEAARRTGARIVSIGATMGSEGLAQELRTLVESMPEEAELWLGGAAIGAMGPVESGPRVVHVKDLPSFENECRRWRN
jgi:methanogenic corrinoid protein MtbC1